MSAKLMSIRFFQIIIVLVFTLQELLANPLHIQQNNNISYNIKLSDYPQLNDARTLRQDLTNISRSVEDLINQLDYWAFEEISNITDSNISAAKLQSLEDSLKILEMNVTELSLEISKKRNIHEVARKSASVQIYLNNLQKKLNNNFRHVYQLINEYFDETNIIDKYDNLTIQKKIIDMKIEEEVQTKLAEDCVNAVRNDNFLKAALLLDLIKNSSKIEYIVESLTIEESFKLGNKIRNISKSFMFYKAIYHGLDNVKEDAVDDLDVITKVIKNIKEGIIDQAKTPTFLKKEAIEFKKRLSIALQDLVFIKMDEFSSLDCDEFDMNFIEEIIMADYRLATEIFYYAYTHHSEVYDLDCLFRRVFVENTFSQSNALKFALFLSYFIDNSCTNDIGACDTFTSLIDKLPSTVRNIIFAKKVCISQARASKFLRLSDISYDGLRYSAYTHEESYYVPEEIWKLTHLENNVFIVQNIGIADTYLDTDLYNDDKSGEHAVYGWHKPPNNGMWKFELTKNMEFFYIKNLARNEFLYISDEVNDFAHTKYTVFEGTDNFEWKISNCTDVKLSIQ